MRRLTLIALVAALPLPTAADDWPQFLGPHRDGSIEAHLDVWGEEGPTVVWRRRGGEGFSGIAVADGRAYTLWAEGRREYLVCLDAATGALVWRQQTGGKYFEPQGGNGPRSTPAVADGLVHAVSATGALVTVDAVSGEPVWSVDLPTAFGTGLPSWGFSGSPVVEGDLLLAETGGGDGSSLTAFERRSGSVVWSVESDGMGYSSPTILELAGQRQAVFFTALDLVAVTPGDGRLLWRYGWPTPYGVNAATPVLAGSDRVFISSGYDTGSALVHVTSEAGAMAAEAGWTSRHMRNHMATSVVAGGYIYGFDNTLLKCIAADTGQERWKARGYGKGTLIRAGELLVVLSEDGQLALVRARPEAHDELARARVLDGRRCWTAPSLAGRRLFLRDDTQVVCVEVPEG
jgi:outer membrane protein assembly factor BamB